MMEECWVMRVWMFWLGNYDSWILKPKIEYDIRSKGGDHNEIRRLKFA